MNMPENNHTFNATNSSSRLESVANTGILFFAVVVAMLEHHHQTSAAVAYTGLGAVTNLAGLEANRARFGGSCQSKSFDEVQSFFGVMTICLFASF